MPQARVILFCSVSSWYARPSIYPTYPAGRQSVPHCPVLCCQFNSVPAYTLLPTECRKPVSLFCSVLSRHARSAIPDHTRPYQTIPDHTKPTRPTQPTMTAADPCRNAGSATVNSIPACTLLPAECRKPVSLFCYVSFRPVLPYSATNPHCTEADRFGSSITTKKICTAHQPPLRRATTN